MDEEDIKPFVQMPAGHPISSTIGIEFPAYEIEEMSKVKCVNPTFRKSRTKINDETRKNIIRFYLQNPNMNQGEIADIFGIDRTTVSKLVKRKYDFIDTEEETSLETAAVPASKRNKTDSLGVFFKKFKDHERHKARGKSIKPDQQQNTNVIHEPPLDYVYLPPETTQADLPESVIQSAREQASSQKVLLRKTLNNSYQYIMATTPSKKRSSTLKVPFKPVCTDLPHGTTTQPNATVYTPGSGKLYGMPGKVSQLNKKYDASIFNKRAEMLKALSKIPSFFIDETDASDFSTTAWVSGNIKVKEEPDFSDKDENNMETDSEHIATDQIKYGGTSVETEPALIKKHFTLPTISDRKEVQWDQDSKECLDDEYLMQYFLTGKAAAQSLLGSLQRRDPGRNQHRRMPPSETVTGDAVLDPSMSLKVSTPSNGTSQMASHKIPKERPRETSGSPENPKQSQTPQDSRGEGWVSDVQVKQEIPDDIVLDDTEAFSRDMKSLEKFREQQKAIEEANKQKKALLSKTLTERRKRARAEAHKLEHIQKELAKLDSLLTADVQVIRDKIEGASRDFLEAQKRFQKAEAEYVEAKMDLHQKSELKEQLTEHLYTIIHQNEVRKAKKLANLMKELEMDSTEEEFHLPELPPLSSFNPIQHGPLSPGKTQLSPVIENDPTDLDSKSDNKNDTKDKENNSDKSLEEKLTENERNQKSSDQALVSEAKFTPSREGKSIDKEDKNMPDDSSYSKTVERETEIHNCETDSPKSDRTSNSLGDKCSKTQDSPKAHSVTEKPDSVKVGQVSQYVRDRRAQINEELETVQNLLKETENGEANTAEVESKQAKIPSSWDFSGDINSIGPKNKS